MAKQVLDRIGNDIREIVRLLTDSRNNEDLCLTKLNSSLVHFNSISHMLDTSTRSSVESSLFALRDELSKTSDVTLNQSSFCADRPLNGCKGRPAVVLHREQMYVLLKTGMTAVHMAKHFACSPSLVYKKLKQNNMSIRSKYSPMTDAELDDHVREIRASNANAGNEMTNGYLRSAGHIVQRDRVRDSLRRIDPVSSASRWSRTVSRRTYSVPTPNSLWHLDSHLKLVRWGFVTHGCVDGFSRLITYLRTSTTNEAKVVLNLFVQACHNVGVPSRVRCDRGNENVDVALFLSLLRGQDRRSVISGKSVHNQRIERMWRDVACQVTEYFYQLFYALEDTLLLDVENDIHMLALRLVFLPLINARMNAFRSAWNNHRLRTEQNRSPKQIWLDGMLQNMHSTHLSTNEIFDINPSLDLRIEQALANFNIDVNQFVGSDTIQPSAVYFQVDASTVYQIETLIAGLTDLKAQYTTAVHYLQTVL